MPDGGSPSSRARPVSTGPGTGATRAEGAEAVEAVRALARVARVLERGSGDLSMAHYRVLSAVAAGEDRASRVAERLGLGRPTVSAAVDALCRGGLLDRREVEHDQRAVDLRLTRLGGDLLEAVEAEMVRRLTDLCARTPDPGAIVEALATLGSALDHREAERLGERSGSRR